MSTSEKIDFEDKNLSNNKIQNSITNSSLVTNESSLNSERIEILDKEKDQNDSDENLEESIKKIGNQGLNLINPELEKIKGKKKKQEGLEKKIIEESPQLNFSSPVPSFESKESAERRFFYRDNTMESEEIDEIKEAYYDDLLNKSDMSLLQIKSLIGAGLIYFIEGLHVSLTGLIFIPIINQYNLSFFSGCLISSSLILFMSFGSLLSGFLSERVIRKKLIIYGLLTVSFFSLISTIHSPIALFISRCIIGLSLGTIIPITANNLSEVLPQKFRSFWIISISVFFSLGAICSCQLISRNLNNLGILFSVISIPSSLVLMILNCTYYENPRYLILIGKYDEAYKIIEKYILLDHHELSIEEKNNIVRSIDIGVNKEVKITGKFRFLYKRYYKITFILSSIWILYSIIINGGVFSLFVGYANNATFIHIKNMPIRKREIKGILMMIQLFYVFLAVSVVISGLFTEIKCCGRKYTILFGFLLSSLLSFHILLFNAKLGIFFIIATCLINISFNAINSYTIEIYPTRVRDFAVGNLTFLSKIIGFLSNIFAVMVNYKNKNWILYLNAIIGMLGIIFTLMLPFDTYRRKLDDILTKKPQIRSQELSIINN